MSMKHRQARAKAIAIKANDAAIRIGVAIAGAAAGLLALLLLSRP